jgi:hypothetical protein
MFKAKVKNNWWNAPGLASCLGKEMLVSSQSQLGACGPPYSNVLAPRDLA